MPDDPDGQLTEFVVFRVGQRLRRGYDDTFARMNPQRIEVLHITNRNTVIETIPDHLVFYFFPTFQTLFHKYLGRERKGFFHQNVQFLFIVTESGTQAAQGIRRPHNHRITQLLCRPASVDYIFNRLALDGLYLDFIQFPDEQFPVFRIHDRLHRRT